MAYFVVVQNENGTNYNLSKCTRYLQDIVKVHKFVHNYNAYFTDDLNKAKRYKSMSSAHKAVKPRIDGWYEVKEIKEATDIFGELG